MPGFPQNSVIDLISNPTQSALQGLSDAWGDDETEQVGNGDEGKCFFR